MDIKRKLPPKIYDEIVLRIASNQNKPLGVEELPVDADYLEKVKL